MPSITFPATSPTNPTHLATGVKPDKGFVFEVGLVQTDAPSQTYAYPNIALMKSGSLFDQFNGNNDLTNGYGIVREQNVRATGIAPGQPSGMNNYPDDWRIAANFGASIPCNIYYCDSTGNVITESAAIQTGSVSLKMYILIKPTANLDYIQDHSVLLDPYMPYKTFSQLNVPTEPGGGGGES